MAQKILHARLWWPTLHKDAKEFWKTCDICQWVGNPSIRDEIPLIPQVILQYFDKWAFYFIGPINPPTKILGARYIITTKYYLTWWVEAEPVRDCNLKNVERFLFENVVIRFGCLRILMSDQGNLFLNKMIAYLTKEFHIYHHKSTLYHPHVNERMEVFNKILEHVLKNICTVNRYDWDLRIPAVLWAY
jgi:hypothetical protein